MYQKMMSVMEKTEHSKEGEVWNKGRSQAGREGCLFKWDEPGEPHLGRRDVETQEVSDGVSHTGRWGEESGAAGTASAKVLTWERVWHA